MLLLTTDSWKENVNREDGEKRLEILIRGPVLGIAGWAELSGEHGGTLKKILTAFSRRPESVSTEQINRAISLARAAEIRAVKSLHEDVMDEIASLTHTPQAKHMDFSRQRPRDRRWLAGNRQRGLATYILVVELLVAAVTVGEAIDVSRTAVGKRVREFEDERERHESTIAGVLTAFGLD